MKELGTIALATGESAEVFCSLTGYCLKGEAIRRFCRSSSSIQAPLSDIFLTIRGEDLPIRQVPHQHRCPSRQWYGDQMMRLSIDGCLAASLATSGEEGRLGQVFFQDFCRGARKIVLVRYTGGAPFNKAIRDGRELPVEEGQHRRRAEAARCNDGGACEQ